MSVRWCPILDTRDKTYKIPNILLGQMDKGLDQRMNPCGSSDRRVRLEESGNEQGNSSVNVFQVKTECLGDMGLWLRYRGVGGRFFQGGLGP